MGETDENCKNSQKDSTYEIMTIKDMIWKKLETIKFDLLKIKTPPPLLISYKCKTF